MASKRRLRQHIPAVVLLALTVAGLMAWRLAPCPQTKWMVEGVAATDDLNLNDFTFDRAVLACGRYDLPGTSVVVEHDPARIVGHVERAWLVRDELRVRVVMSKTAQDAWAMVKEGSLARFSIAVKPLRVYPGTDEQVGPILVVKVGVVVGVSFTSRPADPRAVVTRWWEE